MNEAPADYVFFSIVLLGLVYLVVRIGSAAYFHSKKRFLKEFTNGVQEQQEKV